MNVIRFNWRLIRKLLIILISIYILKCIIIYIYYFNKKPTLIYNNRFELRNLNYSLFPFLNNDHDVEYTPFRLNCINFYYYKLLPSLWPKLIETIRNGTSAFNCINVNVAWNLFGFHFVNDEKVYDFDNRYYDLGTLINLISSYDLYVVISLNAVYTNSYLDFAGLPYWLLNKKKEHVLETLNVEYTIYLNNLFTYLSSNSFFYSQASGGRIVGIIADHEFSLFESKLSVIENIMYENSIYESILKEYTIDEDFNNIAIILPNTFSNYTQLRHVRFSSNAFSSEHNYWGDVNKGKRQENESNNSNKFNQILLNLIKNTNYTVLLNNYHCMHNSHTLNGASLVKNLNQQLHYKPYSNEITLFNCFVNSQLEPTDNYYHLNEIERPTVADAANSTRKSFEHRIDLEYYLNLNDFIYKFGLVQSAYRLNATHDEFNFEQFSNEDYMKLVGSNSHIANTDSTFFYYTAKSMLPKGTLVNIKKHLFADYLIFKCNNRQVLSLNRMNYNQNYNSNKNESDREQIKFLLNDDCHEFNVFVENMGRLSADRITLKKILGEKKGLLRKNAITVGSSEMAIDKWLFYAFNFEQLVNKARLGFNSKWDILNGSEKDLNTLTYPTFFYTRIDLSVNRDLADLLRAATNVTYFYLTMTNWVKGYVMLNGYSLGRYWSTLGPLCSLYLPKVILNFNGINELIIFEMHNTSQFHVKLTNVREYAPCLTNG